MARLIDADEMKADELGAFISAQAQTTDSVRRGIQEIVHTMLNQLIDDAPTVDAEPVRHGRWVYKPAWSNADWGVYLCSECNKPYWWNTDRYCPNCGAKMDGGDGDAIPVEG